MTAIGREGHEENALIDYPLHQNLSPEDLLTYAKNKSSRKTSLILRSALMGISATKEVEKLVTIAGTAGIIQIEKNNSKLTNIVENIILGEIETTNKSRDSLIAAGLIEGYKMALEPSDTETALYSRQTPLSQQLESYRKILYEQHQIKNQKKYAKNTATMTKEEILRGVKSTEELEEEEKKAANKISQECYNLLSQLSHDQKIGPHKGEGLLLGYMTTHGYPISSVYKTMIDFPEVINQPRTMVIEQAKERYNSALLFEEIAEEETRNAYGHTKNIKAEVEAE